MKRLLTVLFACFIPTIALANDITGAGATFPYPVYSKWADEYLKQTKIRINYQSIGSGAGIKQIQAKTLTFGATDMPLSQAELDKHGLVQFPLVIGAVVLGKNIDANLTLTPALVAEIYLGNIKNWNDARIKELNPTANLPNLPISVISRSDGSGTTYLFTKFLSESNSVWKDKIGFNTAVRWPAGFGAKGNEGVANYIKQVKGSIGFVEFIYAKSTNLSIIDFAVNGNIVKPTKESFQNNTWPITAPTYILMHKVPVDKTRSDGALKFFEWVLSNGDSIADSLDYIPLSSSEKDNTRNIWKSIQ